MPEAFMVSRNLASFSNRLASLSRISSKVFPVITAVDLRDILPDKEIDLIKERGLLLLRVEYPV